MTKHKVIFFSTGMSPTQIGIVIFTDSLTSKRHSMCTFQMMYFSTSSYIDREEKQFPFLFVCLQVICRAQNFTVSKKQLLL